MEDGGIQPAAATDRTQLRGRWPVAVVAIAVNGLEREGGGGVESSIVQDDHRLQRWSRPRAESATSMFGAALVLVARPEAIVDVAEQKTMRRRRRRRRSVPHPSPSLSPFRLPFMLLQSFHPRVRPPVRPSVRPPSLSVSFSLASDSEDASQANSLTHSLLPSFLPSFLFPTGLSPFLLLLLLLPSIRPPRLQSSSLSPLFASFVSLWSGKRLRLQSERAHQRTDGAQGAAGPFTAAHQYITPHCTAAHAPSASGKGIKIVTFPTERNFPRYEMHLRRLVPCRSSEAACDCVCGE